MPYTLASADAAPLRRIEAEAPAKVNLYLGVHPRGQGEGGSGRHLTDTIMHALSLADSVVLSVLPAGGAGEGTLSCACTPELPIAAEQNLAWRAVTGFARRLGRDGLCDEPGTRLELAIRKAIPAQAGLAGGSSDAAAAILAAARLWGADPRCPEAIATAQALGSDIAFFLHGGAAQLGGEGGAFVRAFAPLRGSLVIVRPDAGVSTAEAYRAFDAAPEPLPDMGPLLASLGIPATGAQAAGRLGHAALAMRNNLAPAAESLLPELARVREWLSGQPPVLAAQLSGSGSATYAVCGTGAGAQRVARDARSAGWHAAPARFVGHGARIVGDRRRL